MPTAETSASRIVVFFVATFALSWVCFFGAAALGAAPPRLSGMIVLAGVFTPAVVALLMTAWTGAHDPLALSASTVAWVTVGLMWLCAIVCLMAMRPNNPLPEVGYVTAEEPRHAVP